MCNLVAKSLTTSYGADCNTDRRTDGLTIGLHNNCVKNRETDAVKRSKGHLMPPITRQSSKWYGLGDPVKIPRRTTTHMRGGGLFQGLKEFELDTFHSLVLWWRP